MSLYDVNNQTNGSPQDLNQLVDALSGNNDVGAIQAFPQISAPGAATASVNTSSGNLTGNYQYKVALITGYWQGPAGTGTLHTQGNTSGGTTSNTVSPSAQQINLTNIPIGGTGVVARAIYRTKANGSTFYFLQQINDNSTTSWTDNVTDANLGAAMPTTNTTGSYFSGDGHGLTNLPFPSGAASTGANTFTGTQTATEFVATSQTAPLQLPNLTALPAVGPDGTVCMVNHQLYVSNGAAWVAQSPSTVPWSEITGTPTTVAGYGITDGVKTSQIGAANGVAGLDANKQVPANQLGNVPPVNAATGSALGTVELPPSAGSPATPVAVYSANNVKEHLMADTTLDSILTFTPAAAGNFLVAVSVRVVTATTNVTIQITWTDASGTLQTDTRISTQALATGAHDVPIKFINANASAITVQVQAGTANQVYASASIVGV